MPTDRNDNRILRYNQAIVAGVLWEVNGTFATATYSDGSYKTYNQGCNEIPTEIEHLFHVKTTKHKHEIEIEFEGRNVGTAILSNRSKMLTIMIDDNEMMNDIITSRVIFARSDKIVAVNEEVNQALKVLAKHFKGIYS